MLTVSGVDVRFGGVQALKGLALTVGKGEIVSLIGPNGAGKSTAFNVITRITSPSAGAVEFDGQDLLKLRAYEVARIGLGRTFQGLQLFPTMTVGETLEAGHHAVERCGTVAGALRLGRSATITRHAARAAHDVAGRLGLRELLDVAVPTLPYGVQKRVDIARALVGQPRLLLLDEPAAGLTHSDLEELGELIVWVRDELGVAVLLVEHHMSLVMSISDRVHVLDAGRPIAQGTPEEIRADPHVIEAYLGVPAGDVHA